MKELSTAAANYHLVPGNPPDGGPFRPMCEIALCVTEPVYGFAPGGGILKTRTPETLRFHTGPDGLRQLAEMFAGWADQLDTMAAELADRHKPEPPGAA